jgi:hypothetical protein
MEALPIDVVIGVTALCGALFVAWLAGQARAKRKFKDELEAIRAAHALCLTIINRASAMKAQRHAMSADINGLFDLTLDMQSLPEIRFASDALSEILLERCFRAVRGGRAGSNEGRSSVIGARGLDLTVALADATKDLQLLIDYWNTVLTALEEIRPASANGKSEAYLAVGGSDGIDKRIESRLGDLYREKIDRCILFGATLADELLAYGNNLQKRRRWRGLVLRGFSKSIP